MDLGWVGMTQVWSEEVRTSRWTSRWTSSRPTGRTSGSTSGSLKFSDGLSMSHEWSRVVSAEVKEELTIFINSDFIAISYLTSQKDFYLVKLFFQ